MPAAKCEYSLVDTVYLDIPAYKINYKVKTTGLYNLFYKVKNKYSIIFKKSNCEILSYSKLSTQPSVKNKINTTPREKYKILSNIFLLYFPDK